MKLDCSTIGIIKSGIFMHSYLNDWIYLERSSKKKEKKPQKDKWVYKD